MANSYQLFLQITSFPPYFIRSLDDSKKGEIKELLMHWPDGANPSIWMTCFFLPVSWAYWGAQLTGTAPLPSTPLMPELRPHQQTHHLGAAQLRYADDKYPAPSAPRTPHVSAHGKGKLLFPQSRRAHVQPTYPQLCLHQHSLTSPQPGSAAQHCWWHMSTLLNGQRTPHTLTHPVTQPTSVKLVLLILLSLASVSAFNHSFGSAVSV